MARAVAVDGRFPVKVVAETLGVARSNLIDRLKGRTKPRRRYQKAQDAAVVPLIGEVVQAIGADRVRALLTVLRELRVRLEDDGI